MFEKLQTGEKCSSWGLSIFRGHVSLGAFGSESQSRSFLFFPQRGYRDVIAISYHPQCRWQMGCAKLKEGHLDLPRSLARSIFGEAWDDLKEMEQLPQIHIAANLKEKRKSFSEAMPKCYCRIQLWAWRGAQQASDRKRQLSVPFLRLLQKPVGWKKLIQPYEHNRHTPSSSESHYVYTQVVLKHHSSFVRLGEKTLISKEAIFHLLQKPQACLSALASVTLDSHKAL